MQSAVTRPMTGPRAAQFHSVLRGFTSVAAIAAVLAIGGCTKDGNATENTKTVATATNGSEFPAVLATVNNEPITFKDVQARAGDDLDRIETQYHLLRSKIVGAALDSILRERTLGAEAKKQGKTEEELVIAEAGVGMNPTQSDIAAWYQANPDKTGGRALADVSPQIADLIREERKHDAAQRLVTRLNKEHHVTVNYEPYRLALTMALHRRWERKAPL
jgi:hypothetical protein